MPTPEHTALIPGRRFWLYMALLVVPGGGVALGIGAMAQYLRRRSTPPSAPEE